jgi:uncharacterized membrane protein
MAGFEFLVAIISVLSALLLVISILAYKRERTWRLLITSTVFGIFLIKGVILSLSLFTNDFEGFANNVSFLLLIDVIILLFLFFSMISPAKTKTETKPTIKIKEEKKS